MQKRIVVAMSGASGAILGIRLLEALQDLQVETHLIISEAAKKTIAIETDYSVEQVEVLANHVYDDSDLTCVLASGSFATNGMAVVPCSVKTLAGVACGYAGSLILRAADVALKERRPLLLAVRETPLSRIHLRNMLQVSEAGAIIIPPVPAFYMKPVSIDDICHQFVGRVLSKLGLCYSKFIPWQGTE